MFRVLVATLSSLALLFVAGCGPQDASKAEAKSVPVKVKPTQTPEQKTMTKPAPDSKSAVKRDERVTKSWDFRNIDKSKWEWKIPGSNASGSPKGATFTLRKSGTGATNMNVGVKAQDVSAIRVRMSAMRKDKDGKNTPVKLGLIAYWAREGDAAAAKNPAWPFDLKRAVALRPAPNEPDVYVAAVKSDPLWNGTIKCLYVGIDLPSATEIPDTDCTVTLGDVQLLK